MTSKVPGACGICDTLPMPQLVALDLLMGDSSRWPATVWRNFHAPVGPVIPPPMRRWGAVRLGQAWLEDHGFADLMTRSVVQHHYGHVPVLAVDPEQLVESGVMARGDRADVPDGRLNPMAYIEYYNAGIDAGKKGLELLMAHVKALEEKKADVPLTLVKMLVDVGAKLAMSQAAIKSREPSQPQLDDDEGFRAGAGGVPSPRMGHARIRDVDGETRPVHDEGPADRDRYNRRAEQEGSPKL
jgi:hypothetical protein